jgi:hypothetical protein
MMAMPVVHEEVHQGAGEQEQEWQVAEHVGAMFREQQERHGKEEPDGHEAPA